MGDHHHVPSPTVDERMQMLQAYTDEELKAEQGRRRTAATHRYIEEHGKHLLLVSGNIDALREFTHHVGKSCSDEKPTNAYQCDWEVPCPRCMLLEGNIPLGYWVRVILEYDPTMRAKV